MGAKRAAAGGKRRGRAATLQSEVKARAAEWLAAARRVRGEEYTWVRDFEEVCGQARADSWLWCDLLFAPEANPHNEALGARHGFHVANARTIDLLRHEYTARGLDLVVIEGRNFLVVEVKRPGADVVASGAGRAASISRIAGAIFRDLDAEPVLPTVAGKGEGTTFQINARADPMLLARAAQRVDGEVCQGCVHFVRYKKPAQRVGYHNARQWFDEEFRRTRGRAP